VRSLGTVVVLFIDSCLLRPPLKVMGGYVFTGVRM